MSDELRPCPFCGAKVAEVVSEADEFIEKWGDDEELDWMVRDMRRTGYRAVVCNANKGGCGAIGGWKPSETEASKAWNRRAE